MRKRIISATTRALLIAIILTLIPIGPATPKTAEAAWIEQAKLTASDAAAGDNFGHSVSLSGNLALVGAFTDDSSRGSAYLFDISTPASPLQVAKLTASDGAANDFFGYSVALSGTTAVVGARYDDSSRGSAYLFDISTPASPLQVAKLTASDAAVGDIFGHSVSLSSTTVLVSAPGDDSYRGSAYLFDISTPASPLQVAKLTASDGAASDIFGYSVSLSGTTAVVGALGDDSERGSAYLFDISTPASPLQVAKLTASDGAAVVVFGYSVALSGNLALVGAFTDDSSRGSAYLFDISTPASPLQVAKLTASDGAANDFFGYSVALSSTTVLVSARGDDSSRGSAYLFEVITHSVTSVAGNNPQNASGGQLITITGTNFTATPTVTVGGRSATNVTFVSSTTLTATAPSQTAAGNYDVVVINPDLQTATCVGCMRYTVEGSSFLTPSGTFSINHGATCTPTTDVALILTAERATDVVIANNQDPSVGGPWQSIGLNQLTSSTTTIPWALPASDGTHTVHLRYRSVYNIASPVVTRTITLDQATKCGQGSSSPPSAGSNLSAPPVPTEPSVIPSVTPPPIVPESTATSFQRNLDQERAAIRTFTRMYPRLPQSPGDWRAVNYLAYGGTLPNRSLSAEAMALGRFVRIFRHLPRIAEDWRVIHLLAYPTLSD